MKVKVNLVFSIGSVNQQRQLLCCYTKMMQ